MVFEVKLTSRNMLDDGNFHRTDMVLAGGSQLQEIRISAQLSCIREYDVLPLA